MDLSERFQSVAVLGAAGKMGSGISSLLAVELGLQMLAPENHGKSYKLVLMDVSESALRGLRKYLKSQLLKAAEKMTVQLRALYTAREDLVENSEIINQFIEDVDSIVQCTTHLADVKSASMVFEAIIERLDIKLKVFNELREGCSPDTFFFTNTSSIPIHSLDEGAALNGRIVGYHFYNPPVVQKLVELITSSATRDDLQKVAMELGLRLRKKIIPAHDIAGFIGNGHFIRDGMHAAKEVARLSAAHGWKLYEAIYAVNKISQEYLVRPMGIFQLIDYVGIDVFKLIQRVMDENIPDETISTELIDTMFNLKVLGGQNPDGSQKNGFLMYERGKPVGVYDPARKDYVPFAAPDGWKTKIDQALGTPPGSQPQWKSLIADLAKEQKLVAYFTDLKTSTNLAADIAQKYHHASKTIGLALISSGVADSPVEVNGVLTNGFFHVFGPINNYLD